MPRFYKSEDGDKIVIVYSQSEAITAESLDGIRALGKDIGPDEAGVEMPRQTLLDGLKALREALED